MRVRGKKSQSCGHCWRGRWEWGGSLKGTGKLSLCVFWGSWIESEFHSEPFLLRSTLFHDLGSLRGPGPFLGGVIWFRSTMGREYSYLNFLGFGKDFPFWGNIFWQAKPLRFWSWSMSSTGRIFPNMERVWRCHLVLFPRSGVLCTLRTSG